MKIYSKYDDLTKLYAKDKDCHLNTKEHELLDSCKYPTIEEQVALFLSCGQGLDVADYVEEPGVDDSGEEDIDNFSTPIDSSDCDVHDVVSVVKKRTSRRNSKVSKGNIGPNSDTSKREDTSISSGASGENSEAENEKSDKKSE